MIIEKTLTKIRPLFKSHDKHSKIRVLFVCLGNICRSPAAEGVMLSLLKEKPDARSWMVDSAGTGNYHVGDLPDERMRIHARRRGLELTHRCRQVNEGDFDDFDLILAMDSSNYQNLRRIAPSPETEKKVIAIADFFSPCTRYDYVPDPYYEGAEGFELVLDLLEASAENVYDTIEAACHTTDIQP